MALQTKTFSYGSVTDKSVLNGYVLELTVTEQSTDTVKNTSRVDFVLKLRSGSKNRFNLYGIGASVSLDGKVVGSRDRYEESQISLGYNASVTLVSGSTTVTHSDNGAKTMAVAFSIDMATGSYVPGPVSVTGKTMALTVIPRASTIAASDANIGSVSTVVVGRKSTSFTHTVAVNFGSLSGYLNAEGALAGSAEKLTQTTIPFKVPEVFYGQIPNKTSDTCTLTCTTYSGTSVIGTKETTFTVTAAKSLCAPAVSISVKDVNEASLALTGNENMLIRYISTAHCSVSAEAKNGATVQTLQVDGAEVREGVAEFMAVEKDRFTASCTDSRGYSNSVTATAELVPYVKLTCNASAKRLTPTDGTARLTVKGNCYSGSFGAQDNVLSVTYQVGGGAAVSVAPVVNGHTYTAVADLAGLDYTQSFAITVTVADAVREVVKTVTLQPGIPVFDWGQNDFAFHVPVSIEGAPLADFVVEQGELDGWAYRKWRSGRAECFKKATVTVPQNLIQRGNVYYSEPISVAYPFAIAQAFRYATTANAGIISAQITGTSESDFAFRVHCAEETAAGMEIVVFLYAVGRWK